MWGTSTFTIQFKRTMSNKIKKMSKSATSNQNNQYLTIKLDGGIIVTEHDNRIIVKIPAESKNRAVGIIGDSLSQYVDSQPIGTDEKLTILYLCEALVMASNNSNTINENMAFGPSAGKSY